MSEKVCNLISVSGGKDSTATLLLAIERGVENLKAVTADTGHEHPLTYEYIDYLEQKTGIPITRVKADFSKRIAEKKHRLINTLISFDNCHTHDRHSKGYILRVLESMIEVCHPTGNPFLDLCIWKGRFPSTRARFCTDELKVIPITDQVVWPSLQQFDSIESWQGIRWDESTVRSNYVEREGIEPDAQRVFAYRPILAWTAQQVFDYHKKHGFKWNPLYSMGMGRVGCMPCVNARKDEIEIITSTFEHVVKTLREWEMTVSLASKRGSATFFPIGIDPTASKHDEISPETHGIDRVAQWARTGRGGRQMQLIATDSEPGQCRSIYGLCE